MTTSKVTGDKFVYFVPFPALSRVIALVTPGFLISALIYITILGALERDPFLWLLMVGTLGIPIAPFLLLAFPPKSWHARLEVEHDSICLIPVPPLRWIGEPCTKISLGAHTREVLLCRGSSDNSFYGWSGQGNFPYGFRLIVRSIDGHDSALKVPGDRLSAGQSEVLTEGIAAATSLPVRLMQRNFSSDGSFKEVPWTANGHFAQLSGIAKLLFAVTPFIGGVAAGYIHPVPAITVAIGIALWLGQTLALFAFVQFSNQKPNMFSTLYWLTTAITFAASYSVIYFLVSSIARTQTQ